jgi:hypothetical protein
MKNRWKRTLGIAVLSLIAFAACYTAWQLNNQDAVDDRTQRLFDHAEDNYTKMINSELPPGSSRSTVKAFIKKNNFTIDAEECSSDQSICADGSRIFESRWVSDDITIEFDFDKSGKLKQWGYRTGTWGMGHS